MIGLDLETFVSRLDGRWAGRDMASLGPVAGISTDTRTIQANDAFVALEGDRFDGHEFIAEAFSRGAHVCVVSSRNAERFNGQNIVVVDDTLDALERLAVAQVRSLDLEIVAVTGSVGKTTTKEFLRTILSARYRVSAAPKSFNNRLGVALTLLGTRTDTEKLVVELGTSAIGEISYLSKTVCPHRVILTEIAQAHLQGLGSLAGVAEAKAEIFDGLRAGGAAYVNHSLLQHEIVREKSPSNTHTFGDAGATSVLESCEADSNDAEQWRPGSRFRLGGDEYFLPVLGKHNVMNAAAAVLVARDMGMTVAEVREGLLACELPSGRLHVEDLGGLLLVDDSYNANPASMTAALESLDELPRSRGKRVLVLGDMRELGEDSSRLHTELGERVVESDVDIVVTIGDEARHTHSVLEEAGAQRACHCDSRNVAVELLQAMLQDGDQVLFKGSNASGVHLVVSEIREWAAESQADPVNGVVSETC